MAAYLKNREDADMIAIDADPIGTLLIGLVEEVRTWTGTATDLLRELERRADAADGAESGIGKTRKLETWPKQPNVLSNHIERLAPALRRVGIQVDHHRDPTPQRTKLLTLRDTRPTDPDGISEGWEEDRPDRPDRPLGTKSQLGLEGMDDVDDVDDGRPTSEESDEGVQVVEEYNPGRWIRDWNDGVYGREEER